MKPMKIVFWLGENLPLVIGFGMAVFSFFIGDFESMRFFILLCGFFLIIRNQIEIRELLKAFLEEQRSRR